MKYRSALLAFGALFLSCSLLLSGVFFGLSRQSAAHAVSTDAEPPVLILDAGHGGEDGGATGTNGVHEKDLNLSLTRTLADYLRMMGYTVIETRTEDTMLYPSDTRVGHKKQADLSTRVAYTEQYPNSIFISIHMNTYPKPNCYGTQVWYSPNDPASKEWAEAIQSGVKTLLQPENTRAVKASGSNIFVLYRAKTPAILVECGFLSTPEECENLCDPVYRGRLALALFSSISAKISA